MLDVTRQVKESSTAPFSGFHAEITQAPSPLRAAITAAYRRDEKEALLYLLAQAPARDQESLEDIRSLARELVTEVRRKRSHASGVDALMHEFSLSSEEGVALMCLAEALLRIPDHQTANRLIADKLSKGDWSSHLGGSPSLFVNAAAWGLLITGKLMATNSERGLGAALGKLIAKGGEPLIRKGVDLAMRMLGNQFVTGQSIEQALANSRDNEARGYRYSYDMLGEAALTEADAQRYFASYENAIHAIGQASNGRGIKGGPGISVKLSALHPRYSRAQRARVLNELLPRLKQLILLAMRYRIGLNIDAEEADRLELSLDLMEQLAFDRDLDGFDGIGFVTQAYQKRCPFVIEYLADLARRSNRKFMVRLVKGAYWDSEIKRAQVDGMTGYPVYTRKTYTDVSYLVCAQKLLTLTDVIYPQFATHNAHTLAAIHTMARKHGVDDYEFQCLHGMGETLYDQVIGRDNMNKSVRIYAPVGSHETLLAYLVRRLLENGANSSFVNQIVDENIAIESLIADPFDKAQQWDGEPHPRIPLPEALYGAERRNSSGLDLSDENGLRDMSAAFASFDTLSLRAEPLLASAAAPAGSAQPIFNPADHNDLVGTVTEATEEEARSALAAATEGVTSWQELPPLERATILERGAELLERHKLELMSLAVREAGKSLPNAIAEVREAVDFLRYYAAQVAGAPNAAPLGPVACISPWNFPLAIFIGQVSAALAAGNTVLAKPAEQTPLIAYRAVQLLHDAGVPRTVLQFLPGRGETVGAMLTADHRVRGVIFTGSTEVAQLINRTLSRRRADEAHDIALIAETGGQNAMIVDSSALPEQVVQDVLASAFDSAGQRCSALRVLCLQDDIADRTLAMLKGAMRELAIGRPDRLAIDIGPVIDAQAQQGLLSHIERMQAAGKQIHQLPLPDECSRGTFVAPTIIEIASMAELRREVFGPVLHVLRYRRENLPQLVESINATGYGLTLGIHSRIDETIDNIASQAHVGNIYVNRNIIGAVVGVQPFGGEGKSGTGPKAGGPLYLARLRRDHRTPSGMHVIHPPAENTRVAKAFVSLLAWSRSSEYVGVAALGERYARETLLNAMLPLPGPTGERNSLSFPPRGTVLCNASTPGALLNQLIASFATGNRAALAKGSLALLPSGLPQMVRDSIVEIDNLQDEKAAIHIALTDAPGLPGLLPLLAARDGALVPVVESCEEEVIPIWRLVAEKAICVNTTAAGGNASLMTLD